MDDLNYASLNAMAKKKSNGVVRKETVAIPPSMIEILPNHNIRGVGLTQDEYWNQEHIVEYVDKIAHSYTSGVYVPPIVVKFDRDNQKVYVMDGHHRYKGLMKAIEDGADIQRVEVVESKGDETQQQVLMLMSGNSLELSHVEKAEVIARLINRYGHTIQEVSDTIKKSTTYIKDMLRVYDLPLEKKREIQRKAISYAAALAEDRATSPKRDVKKTPPKKVVVEFMENLSNFKDIQADANGDVEVKIPLELLKKFLEV